MNVNEIRGDPIWYQNVSMIYKGGRALEFIPSRDQSYEERLNAIVRFVIYATILLYVYKRQPKFIVFGVVLITLISLMYAFRKRRDTTVVVAEESVAQQQEFPHSKPTIDNPFGNFLLSDYEDNPNKAPAPMYQGDAKKEIDDKFEARLYMNTGDLYGMHNSQRQFYTTSSNTIVNAQEEFMDFCYGDLKKGHCKSNPLVCSGNEQ